VIINGSAQTGKDQIIEFIKYNVPQLSVFNLSTIDPSKSALSTLGWDGKTKNEETRQAMVDLKRISMKLFNGPFTYIQKQIIIHNKFSDQHLREKIHFVHCREPEEIQKFVDHYKENCITLLVRSHLGQALKNGSDDVVENYDYNYIIENNESLDALKVKAIDFAKKHLIQE